MENTTSENQNDLIEKKVKKTSLSLYILKMYIKDNEKELSEDNKILIEKIDKIDKEMLKNFEIKFSDKEKEKGFEFLKLMNK